MSFSFLQASLVWNVLSALAVVLVGVLSLLGGKSRPRGALAFGLFAIVWGIQISIGNLAVVSPTAQLAETLHLISLSCLIATPFFLSEFASSLRTHQRSIGLIAIRSAFAGTSLLAATLLLLRPEMLYDGAALYRGRFLPDWGAQHGFFVSIPFFAAFAYALYSLHRAKCESPTPRTNLRMITLVIGLGLFVGFTATNNLGFYLSIPATEGQDDHVGLFRVIFALLSLVCLYVVAASLRSARIARSAVEATRERIIGFSLLAAMTWGVIEAYLALPLVTTAGLWRLAGVIIIAYGIARWRIYDLPQRATNASATATSGAVAAAAGGAAAYGASAFISTVPAVPVVAGLAVLAAVYLPSMRFARRLFRIDANKAPSADDEALYGQRIESYRAALEASIARGSLEEDREFLAALRERFRISEAEERVLLHYARSSVIVFRDRNAAEAYERLRLLGEGGGGRTWLARDRARDRLVVLKEPLERWQQEEAVREAVLREAKLAAKVRHPNVVSVEEVVEGKQNPVIVMEYLEGGSLADLLRSRGTLPWREAAKLTVDVLRGLEAIHAAGIVHRDVKPSNVLLDGSGNPKIADFGIALPPSTNKTVIDGASTARAGTYHYMAPEVRSGASMGDKRSDLYACAVLLHECLYGSPPGAGHPVVVRNDVPPALSSLLAKGLAERPEERPMSARVFAEDLGRMLRS